MSGSENEDFTTAAAGASKTIPQQCSSLRKNGHVMLKGHPCKIVEMSTSKTGKHGHAKVHLIGIDIFTGKKYEDICPSTHNMDVPVVRKSEYTYMYHDDEFISLMDEKGDVRSDVRLPEVGDILSEFNNRAASGEVFLVCVQSACDMEAVCGFKTPSK